MSTTKRKRRCQRNTELTMPEIFDLLLAPGGNGVFASAEIRRRAWFDNRGKLIAACNALSRPEGFWDYEYPNVQRSRRLFTLHSNNLLTPEESSMLRRKENVHAIC